MKNKKFDTVKMMRDIRDELSKKYNKYPKSEQKDLKVIRDKYKLTKKKADKMAQ